MIKRPRQFKVIHMTGQATLVNDFEYREPGRVWWSRDDRVAKKAGHCFPADCGVYRVPIGQETPLAFDEIPLIVRRASV